MRFYIVDDDEALRSMIIDVIEDYDLGVVVGEASDGSSVTADLLLMKEIDILIIDLLMPVKDGIQTVNDISSSFYGKVIMISQIEDKEMISKAYSLGVEYYITKPINRLEVVRVIEKVAERITLEKSLRDIHKLLSVLDTEKSKIKKSTATNDKSIGNYGRQLLTELGILSEGGSKDLVDILEYLFMYSKEKSIENEFPSLKDIFKNIANNRLGIEASEESLKKEIKATEQRVRRAILQALNYLASLGLTDYTNIKFEEYAANFFDFAEVRKRMLELENNIELATSQAHINSKKFIKVLFFEVKKRL